MAAEKCRYCLSISTIVCKQRRGKMNTGFKELDTILKGLKPGSYNLIGARPAMGKTSFALNIAMYVAMEEKKKVCYFSLDLSKKTVGRAYTFNARQYR